MALSSFTTPIPERGASILTSATGHAVTPYLPGSGKRVVIILSDADVDAMRNLGYFDEVAVTDQMTGIVHTLRRASCGAGCRCAVEFVP